MCVQTVANHMTGRLAVRQFCGLLSTMLSLPMKKKRKYLCKSQDLPVIATMLHFNFFLVLISAFYMAAFSVHLLLHGRQVCRKHPFAKR